MNFGIKLYLVTLLAIPYLYHDINAKGIRSLCNLNETSDVDLNHILNISRNSSKRFNNLIRISKQQGFIIWSVKQDVKLYTNYYQKIVHSLYKPDFLLAMEIFHPEVYVDIYVNEPVLYQICARLINNKTINFPLFHNGTDDICVPHYNSNLLDAQNIQKIRFSQRYEHTLKMYEDYGNVLVQTLPWAYNIYYLSKLSYYYTLQQNKSNFFLPSLNVILYNCESNSSLKLEPNLIEETYEKRVVYVRPNKLCSAIKKDNIYHIAYKDKAAGIDFLRPLHMIIIYERYDRIQPVIYIEHTAIYDYINSQYKMTYSVFDIEFNKISKAFSKTLNNIILEDGFWLNMTRIVNAKCVLTLYNFVDDRLENINITSDEMFEVKQSSHRVTGFIKSRSSNVALVVFKNCVIQGAVCMKDPFNNDTIFITNLIPKFVIRRRLVKCHKKLY